VSSMGGNGPFQVVNLPPGGGQAVILPRWNVLALATKPAVLSIGDISTVPEIVECFPKQPKVKHFESIAVGRGR
jgi:hypothetical protein